MRWDYPTLDINPVFPGLGDIIVVIIIIIIIIIIITIIILPTDRPEIIPLTTCTTKNKVAFA